MAFLLKCTKGIRVTGYCRRYSSSPIIYSEEVSQARKAGKPIVALESTIITHGMPYPQNLETAVEVENIIRNQGAVPATIAILKGQLTVGLAQNQLEYLAQAKGVVKASRRDLAGIVAAKMDGATTVAGTIIAAELADIPIFVTGGIGGVHREGENTMDVSADLNELGRSRTLVVCSGVKSILDIGRTLEYLETQGVCVCAFGNTHDFPAFYTRRSGYSAPHRVSGSLEAARLLLSSRTLRLSSGIVIAVPVPEEHAMDERIIEDAINKALSDAKQQDVSGKEVTPFILAAVAKATEGASLNTNIALIKNNAKVGADIAVEYEKVRKASFNVAKKYTDSKRYFHTWSEGRAKGWVKCEDEDNAVLFPPSEASGDVLVIGGANVDRTYRSTEAVHFIVWNEPKQQDVSGKEVTPFILAAVAKATEGASLNTNIALIKNNAKIGADIAVEYEKVRKASFNVAKKYTDSKRYFHTWSEGRAKGWVKCEDEDNAVLFPPSEASGDVLVIGGANVDRTYRSTEAVHLDGSTHPCSGDQCGGGVGRNIAEALWRLRGGRTRLLTAVGDDPDGQYLAGLAPGLILDGCIVKNARTSTYAAVLDPAGDCVLGLGDMALHNHITVDLVNKHLSVLEQAPLVVIDGNVPQATMDHVLEVCRRVRKPVFFEPTDRRKATKALKHLKYGLSYSSPNLAELRAMAMFLGLNVPFVKRNDLAEVLELASIVSKAVGFIIVTLGERGVVTIRRKENYLIARFYPVKAVANVENVSGAGDCFTSGFISGMLSNYKEAYNVHIGFQAAKCALQCKNTVPSNLRAEKMVNDTECVSFKLNDI